MNEKTKDGFDIIAERIKVGRDFIMKFNDVEGIPEDYETDQYLKKPQPPLAKAPVTDEITDLPKDFSSLDIDNDFLGFARFLVFNRSCNYALVWVFKYLVALHN